MKTVLYWFKNRHIDLWERTESLEIDVYKYSQLFFDKGGKAMQWSKYLFKKWCSNN